MEPSGAPWRVLETADTPAPGTQAGRSESGSARPVPWMAIAVAISAVAVAGAGALFAIRPEPIAGVEGAGAFAAAGAFVDVALPSAASVAPAEVVVDVSGAVAKPGVYRLPGGSRVGDAIAAAGGYGPAVDAALADRQLNLAAVVADGDKVRVPVRGEAPSAGVAEAGGGDGTASAGGSTGGLVDLNRASATELDTLPGVGPATAAKIIAAREERPFASLDELTARKVVGPATLEKIRALATVRP